MNTKEVKTHKVLNLIHTTALILSMAGILGLVGWMMAGYNGAKLALILAAISFLFAPRMPVGLIMKAYGAKPIPPGAIPQLNSITRALSKRAKLGKTPVLYFIPSNGLNAFAAGNKDDSAIGITHGLLNTLSPTQMAGIMGHEISHIKNNDMQVMWIAALFSRLTVYGSSIGQIILLLSLPMLWIRDMNISLFPLLLLVFSPAVSRLLNLALSRTREFEADLGSAVLTGNPHYLASALTTLEQYRRNRWENFLITTSMNRPNDSLSTHPHSGQRIRRLLTLASGSENKGIGKRGRSGFQNINRPERLFHHIL